MSPYWQSHVPLSLVLVSLALGGIPPLGGPTDGPVDADRVRPAVAGTRTDGMWARDTRSDVDFVLLGGHRPVFLRARLHIGEQGCHEAWTGLFKGLHAYLDTDQDGILTDNEAGRTQWSRLFARPYEATKAPPHGLAGPRSRTPEVGVTPEDLSSYVLETRGIGAVGFLVGPPANPGMEAHFGLLDRDGDGAIAPGELIGVDRRLRSLDVDEDEALTPEELAPPRSSFSVLAYGIKFDDKGPSSPVVSLASEAGRRLAARRIVDRFRGSDADSIPGELLPGIRPSRRLLGQDEVLAYLECPEPDLLIDVSLGREGPPDVEIRGLPAPGSRHPEKSVGQGGAIARCAGLEVEIQAVDVERQHGASIRREFAAADRDESGAVSAEEARGNAIVVGLLEVADRNADGSLTEAEVQAYRDLANAVTSSRCQVMVYDTGPALFCYLDQDKDDRLSVREIRGTAASLLRLDRDADGVISAREVPRRYVLQIGRGFGLVQGFFMLPPVRPGEDDSEALRQARPGWFAAMDLNGDGDVSPREFHGPPDTFKRLDGDRDGLIDSGEAAEFQKSVANRPR